MNLTALETRQRQTELTTATDDARERAAPLRGFTTYTPPRTKNKQRVSTHDGHDCPAAPTSRAHRCATGRGPTGTTHDFDDNMTSQ